MSPEHQEQLSSCKSRPGKAILLPLAPPTITLPHSFCPDYQAQRTLLDYQSLPFLRTQLVVESQDTGAACVSCTGTEPLILMCCCPGTILKGLV